MFAGSSDGLLVVGSGRMLSNKMLDDEVIRSDRRAPTSVKQGTARSKTGDCP